MRYPSTTRLDLVETLHGVQVTDPYRWLEDPATPETVAWSQAQAELFDGWMAGCPGRRVLRDRVGRLLAAGLVSAPAVRDGRWFFERRRGDQEHPVLLVREADGSERVLIDPSALSEEGTVTLDGWFVSLEGTRLAYQLSEGGDEEPLLWVLDVGTGEVVEGPIERTRYCVVAWLPPPRRAAHRQRRAGVRGRAREDRVPRPQPLRRRPLAGRRRLSGHGAAQRPLHRRPAGRRGPAAGPGGRRRRDPGRGRARRAAVAADQPGRPALPGGGRRPGRSRARPLA